MESSAPKSGDLIDKPYEINVSACNFTIHNGGNVCRQNQIEQSK